MRRRHSLLIRKVPSRLGLVIIALLIFISPSEVLIR